MKSDWHGMFCPRCKTKHGLRVIFLGMAKLTPDGTQDDGDHEWDDSSRTICGECGFEGEVRMFRFADDAGEEVDLQEGDRITFEADCKEMIVDDKGDHICAEDVGQSPEFYTISMIRRNGRTGKFDVIEEYDEPSDQIAYERFMTLVLKAKKATFL